MEILNVIDALDAVRYVIADDDDFKPPEVRDPLLKIHTLAFKQLGEGFTLEEKEIEELANLVYDSIQYDRATGKDYWLAHP